MMYECNQVAGQWTGGRDVAASKYKGYTTVDAGIRNALSKNNISLVGDTKNLKSGDTAIYVFGEPPMLSSKVIKIAPTLIDYQLRILPFWRR